MKTIFALFIILGSGALAAPQTVKESARQIPVAASADVVVVGGSTAAVEAAVSASRAGARVFLMAPRNYLGEDMAGTLRLWLEPGETPQTELCRKIFAPEGMVTAPEPFSSLKFTYQADQPSTSRHPDSPKKPKLSDGKAEEAQTDSVQYEAPVVTLTADLGAPKPIKEARLILFQRAGDYQADTVRIETSLNGKTWKPAGTVKCEAKATCEAAAPVAGPVRMVRFRVQCAKGSTRMLVGEILLVPVEAPKPVRSAGILPAMQSRQDACATRPMHVKTTLEDALAAAGVNYLYGCFPSDLLRDEGGKPCGVVMANRSGRQAVLAKTIIDASEHGTVARLAGARFTAFGGGPVEVKWITIGEKPTTSTSTIKFSSKVFNLPVALYEKKGESRLNKPAAWIEYSMKLNLAADTWAARQDLEQQARDLCFDPAQYYSADGPLVVPPAAIEAIGKDLKDLKDPKDLDIFRPAGVERLWVLSGCAGIPREEAAKLLRPASFMAAGEKIGKAAAEEAKKVASGKWQVASQSVKVARGEGQGASNSQLATGEVKEPLGGLRPLPKPPRVEQPEAALPVLGSYDVVVVGGGTAGGPAGVGAARRGAKTLVIEYLSGLGGVGTLGMIGGYYHGNRVGITAQIPDGPLDLRMEWYRRELRKAGADIWFQSIGCGALTEGNKVTGVVVATPMGRGVVLAKSVVDATGNADIAIQGGARTVFVEDDFAVQNSHVPLREVGAWYMNGNIPATADEDPLDVRQAQAGRRGKTFDRGQAMASRERRRIIGDFTVDWTDVFNTRTFPDSITLSKSNYDSHGYQIHPYFMLRSFNYRAEGKTSYSGYTPYRALLPKGVEGILVAGLAMSAHRDAMPILRMQPDLHNQGYAAGVAAAMAAKAGITPRQVDVKALQKHLVEVGNLAPEVLGHGDNFPMPKEKIAAAVKDFPKDFTNLGVLLAQPADAAPMLRQAWQQAEGPEKAAYAEALGVMGDGAAMETLMKEAERLLAIKDESGMAPIGGPLAVEPLARVAWALGGTKDRKVVPMLCTLAGELDGVNLARYRAVVVSLGRLGERAAVPTLTRLIKQSTESDPEGSVAGLDTAVALYRCGDPEGLARRTLEWYVTQPNGPWADLAAQVLRDKPGKKTE